MLDERPSLDDGVAPQVQERPLISRNVMPQDGATGLPPRTREGRGVHASFSLVLLVLLVLSGVWGIYVSSGSDPGVLFFSFCQGRAGTRRSSWPKASGPYIFSVCCGRCVQKKGIRAGPLPDHVHVHVHFPGDWNSKGKGGVP